MNAVVCFISLFVFSNISFASQGKISTLDNVLEEVNTAEVDLAQKKSEKRGVWSGDLSAGKTKTFATDSSPDTTTLDLSESIYFTTVHDWQFGVDSKQDHEDDGLNVVETGLDVQKKIFYTKPPAKKKKGKAADDNDDDEPFYPSLIVKVRLASGSTSEGALAKKTKNGATLPVFQSFKEKNEGIYFTWDFSENWSAGVQFTQYQYIGFQKAQAYLYAHPGIATLLSGATSSVSGVVDHEEVLNLQWFFTSSWDVNATETLQTDYVTGDVGTTSQLDFTWNFLSDWDAIFTVNYETITASPNDPADGFPATPAQYVWSYGAAVAYNW